VRAEVIKVFLKTARRCTSPINKVPNPREPKVPNSIITDIAADAKPTYSGGNWRAANHQYINPRLEVMAVVLTIEEELKRITHAGPVDSILNLFNSLRTLFTE
jgi:hypothetical protein